MHKETPIGRRKRDGLFKSATAWRAATAGEADQAVAILTAAADQEDALEKLPLTPGPIVPARVQLGELLLDLGKTKDARKAFDAVVALSPARLGTQRGRGRPTDRGYSSDNKALPQIRSSVSPLYEILSGKAETYPGNWISSCL